MWKPRINPWFIVLFNSLSLGICSCNLTVSFSNTAQWWISSVCPIQVDMENSVFHPARVEACMIFQYDVIFSCTCICINSLWPGDTIWWHRTGSALIQVMSCCLTALSHYLNQFWPMIKCSVAFTWDQFHKKCSWRKSVTSVGRLHFWNYFISLGPMSSWKNLIFQLSSLGYVLRSFVFGKSVSMQVMTWNEFGVEPLPESMMTKFVISLHYTTMCWSNMLETPLVVQRISLAF